MADSTKRPLVSASEFRGSGKSGGGGGMDKAAKIKAGASIFAILVAMLFLAFYFNLFGGGDALPPDVTQADVAPLTPEEKQEVEEIHAEELERAQDSGATSVGS